MAKINWRTEKEITEEEQAREKQQKEAELIPELKERVAMLEEGLIDLTTETEAD